MGIILENQIPANLNLVKNVINAFKQNCFEENNAVLLFYQKQLSVFLGATNLIFTGLSYTYNNNDIQNLKDRAERIEKILTSTCVQVCY